MKNRKMWNRVIACALLTVTTVCASLPEFAYAAEPNTAKEEVVYANLQADGSIDNIYVVNIFELENAGQIKDYGKYSSVRNMTSTEEIEYKNDEITINASEGKLYYEGALENAELPWKINIQYYMDSKKCSAEEVAGKSGKLKIKMSIEKNEDCDTEFFEGYALQASLKLDTENCKNIVAEGATIANVGSVKQLTYTILPGQGAEVSITADVTDFEMDGVSINGIPLNLNIEIENEELMSMVTELVDAIVQLDNGASELQDGAEGSLQTGVKALQSGATSLNEGIVSLNDGILQIQTALATLNAKSDELQNGSKQIQAALKQIQTALSGVSVTTEKLQALTDASSSIKTGITELTNGIQALEEGVSSDALNAIMLENGLDVDYLQEMNTNAAAQIETAIPKLLTQLSLLEKFGMDTSQYKAQLEQLQDVVKLLEANNAYISGTETYLDTVNGKIDTMLAGAQTLQSGYNEFDAAILQLVDTLGSLASNMTTLVDGINTLVTEYDKFGSGLDAYTDGVAQILGGYAQLSTGSSKLVSGSKELKTGTDSLKNGTSDLLSGISQLSDGTAQMREETSGIDTKIDSKIDELINSMTGGDMELTSFVSDKNTNIEMVQFVIQTEGVHVEEVEAEETVEEEEPTFWEKLLNLFGL